MLKEKEREKMSKLAKDRKKWEGIKSELLEKIEGQEAVYFKLNQELLGTGKPPKSLQEEKERLRDLRDQLQAAEAKLSELDDLLKAEESKALQADIASIPKLNEDFESKMFDCAVEVGKATAQADFFGTPFKDQESLCDFKWRTVEAGPGSWHHKLMSKAKEAYAAEMQRLRKEYPQINEIEGLRQRIMKLKRLSEATGRFRWREIDRRVSKVLRESAA